MAPIREMGVWRALRLSVLGALVWLAPATAVAQSYPNSPINLVIPLAPGDAADVSGRALADELARLLKVPVVAMNRPGAGMTIGADAVAKAKKDGYTLLYAPNAALVSSRILNPQTPYDPFKDLTPLGLAMRTPLMVAIRPDAPFKGFKEMIEYAKKNPGKVRIGTAGAGSVGHFTVEIINGLTGAELVMVPFKGAAPAVTALLGGHIEGVALAVGALASHLKSGAMRGVVTSSSFPAFPDVPTLTQLGYKQNFVGVWLAFFAPAGVPAEVTGVLVPAIEKAVKDPGISSKLAGLGIVPDYLPPDRLLSEMREEYKTVEEIAKRAGLVK